MSSKLIAAMALLFFIGTLLSAIMEGAGGVNTTSLTSDITAADTTIPVSSTEGYLYSDILVIGNEKIRYTSKTDTQFNIPATSGRAYDGTTAVAHDRGAYVLSKQSDVINQMLGFNIAATGTTVGSVSIMTALTRFLFTSVPKLVTWDYSWLTGPLLILRLILAVASTGFTIYMVYMIASALGGIMQSIFVRF